jgi:hypothetical protein
MVLAGAGVLVDPSSSVAASPSAGANAVAAAVLFGYAMPPPEATVDLPSGIQGRLAEYRRREASFRSSLTPPPGATPEEERVFERRLGIERVVYCLFDRRDAARIAALYALDVDVSFDWADSPDLPRREATFINQLLTDLPQPWLAPYLNLIAGHRRLCAAQLEAGDAADAERAKGQLTVARNGGHPLIRAVAEHLLTAAPPCSPSL